MKYFFVYVLLLACVPARDPPPNLRVACWNVQNLFDVEWQGTEYPEYDPRPPKDRATGVRWDLAGFNYRIKSLAEVLNRLDADILALIEIENDTALRQLNVELSRPYPYFLLLPQKSQAINMGLLSRVPITSSRRHEVGFGPSGRPLRALIEVHLENELVLFLNHWKSQREGFDETLALRRQAAAVLAARLKHLQQHYVLVMGDFNEAVDSQFRYGTSSFGADWFGLHSPWFAYDAIYDTAPLDKNLQAPILKLPPQKWPPMAARQISRGSYYFRGQWLALDNIFLSPLFFNGTWRFVSFTVPRFAMLLQKNGQPRPWRQGPPRSGISDHLPLLLELRQE